MANELLGLQIPLTYGLKSLMQGLCRGIILVPTNQYYHTKFLKKHYMSWDSCVHCIPLVGGCPVLVTLIASMILNLDLFSEKFHH